MELKISTLHKPCEIELNVLCENKARLNIVGYDPVSNQKYFDRNLDVVSKSMTLRFGCPVSPKVMKVKVSSDSGNNSSLKVSGTVNRLDSKLILLPKIREYCDFVKEFSGNYHKYPSGKKYLSRNGRYRVVHSPFIIGSNGSRSTTPARIHKTKHYIEVSKEWFGGMTVPMRVFILCHEFSHVYLNKDPLSESEADINGARLYLDMGFPVIELVYSFSKVFGDTPQTRHRADNIMKFLKAEKND